VNSASTQREPSASSAGSVVGALGLVLAEFKDTADAFLNGLRERANAEVEADGGIAGLDADGQLRELRAAMPRRELTLSEGLQVAERQASLLRWELEYSATPSIPTDALTGLRFLTVTSRAGLAKSGLLTKTGSGWVIVLRSDEPLVRQRFSLAHEIKHAIDDELLGGLPEGLYRSWDDRTAGELAERVCDHFAGCLLIPKLLLRREWTSGVQNVGLLAKQFNVSRAAMTVRLHQTGLIERTQRCGTPPSGRLDFGSVQSNDRETSMTPRNEAS
jgi:hypothetical protein